MAEQNPIKYTDLFAEDVNTGLQATIVELENLNKAYTGMATTMRQQAAALSESLKMVSGATGEGQKRTREAASEADKLEKAYRQLDFAMSDNARRLAELKAITKAHPELIYMAAENCCYWAFIETWKKMHEDGTYPEKLF